MRWEWKVGEQRVSADISLLTGHEKIAVDGAPVFSKVSMKFRNEVPLSLHCGEARVIVSMGPTLLPDCALLVGEQAVPPVAGSGTGAVPSWAWIFVAACAVIPFITLGGALPAGIGFGAAVANYQVASSQRARGTKFLILIAITVAAWVALAALLVTLHR